MTTLLTKRQAAALLGVHPETLMRLCRGGKLPKPIRPGGDSKRAHVRFIKDEVEKFIAERAAARDAKEAA